MELGEQVTSASQDSQIANLFTSELSDVKHLSFVLSNNTDQAIIAIAVAWVWADERGLVHSYNCFSDSFSTSVQNVVGPHSKLIVAPLLFLPEPLISLFAAGRLIGPTKASIANESKVFTQAKSVDIRIDSIAFSDGEIVGPDTLHFPDEIVQRAFAADAVVRLLRDAGHTGTTPASVLTDIAKAPRAQRDNFTKWKRWYAKSLLRAPNLDQQVAYLASLPRPPTFFRRSPSRPKGPQK